MNSDKTPCELPPTKEEAPVPLPLVQKTTHSIWAAPVWEPPAWIPTRLGAEAHKSIPSHGVSC